MMMSKGMGIHNYKRRLEKTLENIKGSKLISSKNRKIILEFHDFCFSDGLSVCKIERYLYDLYRFTQMLGNSLDKATKKDLQKVVAEIERKEWSPHSKHTFKVMIKKFYRYIEGIDEKGVYPEKIRWLHSCIKNGQTKLPEELLTEEEAKSMINAVSNVRDRALISILYESGCRIGEVGSLRIKDVFFDEFGIKINVMGKTGARRIRLVNSTPYLQEWINRHPYNDNSDNYIWIKEDGNPLSYTRISSILKESGKRAGIKKRIYPHLFRHSRATYLATHLTEAQMKDYLGWTQSSKMAGIYVHLSGRDTDKAILKLSGVEVEEEEKKQELTPKKCLRCKTVNEVTNKFCKLCGLVLDKEEADKIIEDDSKRKQADEVMNRLINDPEVLELIRQKLTL